MGHTFARATGMRTLITLSLFLQLASVQGAPPYVHDPCIIKQADYYYLFSTAQGIAIKRSLDLLDWEILRPVFAVTPKWVYESVPGFNGSLWAPDICFMNGRYCLYYSASTFGRNRSCIGLAVNETLDPADPRYEWQDLGKVIESFPGRDFWNAIDPNLIVAADGRCYLSFGSFWGGIKMVEINPETGKPFSDAPEPLTLAYRPGVPDDPIEAPFIIRRGEFYYLFVSFDFCCRGIRSTYKIAVGRSTRVTGPYTDRQGLDLAQGGGTVILEGSGEDYGPGHNAVLREGGKDWLVYHVYDGTRGGLAVLRIRPLVWTENGWPLVKEPLGVPSP